jgi:hypothetical protein
MRLFRIGLAFTACAALMLTQAANASETVPENKPAGHPAMAATAAQTAPAEEAAPAPLSGKVVETMDAGGYTYVNVENSGQKMWVAIPQTKVTKNSVMFFKPGYTMENFNSKSLNRTFDKIVFSPGPMALPAAQIEKTGTTDKAKHGSKTAAPAEQVNVEKAEGKNAFTVADLYEKAASLKDKDVVVKGKVVKVSLGIMGKNWLHLQDGTGKSDKGTHDMLVTTDGEAAVGDTVTATGSLRKDKDFGAGYAYEVMIEDAKISK